LEREGTGIKNPNVIIDNVRVWDYTVSNKKKTS